MDNKTKLVIVGNIAFDINTFPKRENGIDKIVKNRGGAAYYSAIPASIYTKTGIVSKVGYDFNIENSLKSNTDLKGLEIIKNSKTSKFHHTYLTKDGKDRTFKPEIYEKTLIKANDIPKEYYNAKFIHIATNFPNTQKECIKK